MFNRKQNNLTASQRLSRRRRGIIFITALGILVILGGLVISFAQNMRVEALAAANRASASQADMIELGAEQWVLANVEGYTGDSMSLTQLPTEGLPVGNGYFWVIRPNFDDNTRYDYGLVDEASKINLNKINSARLQLLPDVTQEFADAILDWRRDASQQTGDGAESDYYNGLQEPYDAKNAPFETVEELNLVKGYQPFADNNPDGNVTLFGYDLNRDGVIDEFERNAEGTTTFNADTDDTRGLYPYLTVYSSAAVTAAGGRGGGGGKTTTTMGLINLWTAPSVVLQTIPGIDQSTADAIVSTREQSTPLYTDTSWLNGIVNPARPPMSTYVLKDGTSYQYSADIVAVSGDGRAFRRVRIVVDSTNSPATILYRKDLTSYGWPLPPEIQAALRSGKGITPNTPGVGVILNN